MRIELGQFIFIMAVIPIWTRFGWDEITEFVSVKPKYPIKKYKPSVVRGLNNEQDRKPMQHWSGFV